MKRHRTRDCPRRGFTLIELVVSAVLASILMAACLNIMWSALREGQELERRDSDRAAVDQMVDVLLTDLQNARGMVAGEQELVLHGFLGIRDGRPDHSPGRVRYAIVRAGDHNVLVRSVESVGGSQSSLVWLGMGAFQMDVLAMASEVDAAEAGSMAGAVETGGLPEIPDSFRVRLISESGRVLHSEVVHHHAM
ncbi:PulJ/GspJ family protein [Stieleria varia]|uniref:Prepilin-type N-terminal cleavage/methylation domain-containing protein n=1 Tax=Stieleria varia TaxID=2528005 RepID=A0A5C6AG21_9BACT|nr:type II secretion system protein [Stieleria varia]TWT98400.1 hypothetical protein Pla52n_49130 [Stieleria varia]